MTRLTTHDTYRLHDSTARTVRWPRHGGPKLSDDEVKARLD
jgi:hypothetical protein